MYEDKVYQNPHLKYILSHTLGDLQLRLHRELHLVLPKVKKKNDKNNFVTIFLFGFYNYDKYFLYRIINLATTYWKNWHMI